MAIKLEYDPPMADERMVGSILGRRPANVLDEIEETRIVPYRLGSAYVGGVMSDTSGIVPGLNTLTTPTYIPKRPTARQRAAREIIARALARRSPAVSARLLEARLKKIRSYATRAMRNRAMLDPLWWTEPNAVKAYGNVKIWNGRTWSSTKMPRRETVNADFVKAWRASEIYKNIRKANAKSRRQAINKLVMDTLGPQIKELKAMYKQQFAESHRAAIQDWANDNFSSYALRQLRHGF